MSLKGKIVDSYVTHYTYEKQPTSQTLSRRHIFCHRVSTLFTCLTNGMLNAQMHKLSMMSARYQKIN